MADVLDKIMAYKRKEVEAAKAAVAISALRFRAETASPVRPFACAMRNSIEGSGLALIAEIKKASPSKGLIRADFRGIPIISCKPAQRPSCQCCARTLCSTHTRCSKRGRSARIAF